MTNGSFRPLAHLAYLGLGLTAGMTVLGHVGADSRLTAWGSTISDFAAVDFSGPVSIGIFLCVAASLALFAGLRRAAAPMGRWTKALLLTWCGGLAVTALVPTDNPFTLVELSAAGWLHRVSASLAFVALIAATFTFAHGLRADEHWRDLTGRLRAMAAGATVTGGLIVASTYFGDRFLIGLAERTMAAFAVGALVVVAMRLLKLAERPVRLAAPRPALAF
ncbi:DUF998 domain-containing protein [Nonomuraea sp. NPDC050310]|uniref:DUF998 domain-containing protein n=1 Tax=unclassified Nonomuraea TaxID=2593643 RepID=UPI003410CF32